MRIFKNIIYGALLSTFVIALSAEAQVVRAPADTGIISWGHDDLTSYTHPSMCDRAVHNILRSYLRLRSPDTSIVEIVDSVLDIRRLPGEAAEVGKRCISQFQLQSVDKAQLWSYARLAAMLEDFPTAHSAIEMLYNDAPDSSARERVLYKAFGLFLQIRPRQLDIAHEYLARIDAMSERPVPAAVSARISLASYWHLQYNKDSVLRYAKEAISITQKMDLVTRDKVNATYPYILQIDLANEEGDLLLQQSVLDSMAQALSDWGAGKGSMAVAAMQNLIDFRRTLYNKKTNPITEGLWFNHGGIERPAPGQASLMVLTNHLCGFRCREQYNVIKELSETFKDDLHITIVTPSSGYVLGSFVLSPEEEGDSVVKFFTEVLDMPFSVLLDPRPVSNIPDGRKVYGVGPVAEMFAEWKEMNAVLTDIQGRIQWMGSLSGRSDKRPLAQTIERIISKDK